MRTEIFAKHWGLADLLRNLLEKDNEVLFNLEYGLFPERYNFKYGHGDVHISTFPYDDIKSFKKDKPIVLYATDPVPERVFKEVVEIQKWPGCITIAAEPCYPKSFWPITYEFEVPFVIDINKYVPWKGGINRVAVVNRKTEDRWKEVCRGATGIAYTLEQFFGIDIPFDVFKIESDTEYRQKLSEYDVLFYFSNSPYTIVMFEAMGIGMPIVAFNHHHLSTYKPIEKYIENRVGAIEDTRIKLKEALANPKKVLYPIIPFENVVHKWNFILKEANDRYARL